MNFDHLKDKIINAGEIAFTQIRKDFPDHHFYSFNLYTTSDFGYLVPTSSSYEGLTQAITQYQTIDSYKERNLESLQKELKWSPCDSPLHLSGEGIFDDYLANDMSQLQEVLSNSNNDSEFDAYCQKIEHCIISAMKELDHRGVFGSEEDRKNILLNLLKGNQSDEERTRFASLLNTPEQVESYKSELPTY